MAKKMNWRADLQKIRNNREKADNAAKRAGSKMNAWLQSARNILLMRSKNMESLWH